MAQTVADLETCLADAKNQGDRNECMRKFRESGGNREEGGKVFSDSAGDQIATTQNGGKVFHQRQ